VGKIMGKVTAATRPKEPRHAGTPNATDRCRPPRSKPYKIFAGDGLYLYVSATGGKVWRIGYRGPGGAKTFTMRSGFITSSILVLPVSRLIAPRMFSRSRPLV
jgi:hypothetical protein